MRLTLLPRQSESYRVLQQTLGQMPLALQRGIAVFLILTAFTLLVLHALSFNLSLAGLTIMLLIMTLLILVAITSTGLGMTSLIGLFFLTTVVFTLSRPILWLFTRSDIIYDLTFGFEYISPESLKIRLLLFWCIAISGFFGGYFLLYRDRPSACPPLAPVSFDYCRRVFYLTLAIMAVVIPFTLISNLHAFATAGYVGLYAAQTHYRFSPLRLADYLLPVMFALAVLLRRPRYAWLTAATASLYVLAGLIVGERASAGQWILVALWYMTAVSGKRLNRWLLLGSGLAAIVFFQFLVAWRAGQTTSLTLLYFFTEQGITFLLPELSHLFPRLPVHTVVASLIPLGGIYSVLGIGSAETESMGNYLSSHVNIAHFEAGHGLGGTFSLEIYYAVGAVLVLFAGGCIVAGWILRSWESRAQQRILARFYLCACLPYILFLPRGTISSVTGEAIYASIYMAASWLLITLLVIASRLRPAGLKKYLVIGSSALAHLKEYSNSRQSQ
jgi:O-antigen polysaccharide polymerase Wzy